MMCKCTVCRKRFVLNKENVYQASETLPFTKALSEIARVYDVTDCPKCGCQVLLKIRMPKFTVPVEQEG